MEMWRWIIVGPGKLPLANLCAKIAYIRSPKWGHSSLLLAYLRLIAKILWYSYPLHFLDFHHWNLNWEIEPNKPIQGSEPRFQGIVNTYEAWWIALICVANFCRCKFGDSDVTGYLVRELMRIWCGWGFSFSCSPLSFHVLSYQTAIYLTRKLILESR